MLLVRKNRSLCGTKYFTVLLSKSLSVQMNCLIYSSLLRDLSTSDSQQIDGKLQVDRCTDVTWDVTYIIWAEYLVCDVP